jgi:hypothetical protein
MQLVVLQPTKKNTISYLLKDDNFKRKENFHFAKAIVFSHVMLTLCTFLVSVKDRILQREYNVMSTKGSRIAH